MAIKTDNGNAVKFLGLSNTIRANLLEALLGGAVEGKAEINTANVCYLGLSSTEPSGDGTGISEPSDLNYRRVKLSWGEEKTTNGKTSVTLKSDYLNVAGIANAQAVNERGTEEEPIPSEIKFNRSLGAWDVPMKYFFITTSKEASEDSAEDLLAWGELTEPITVTAKNVVPLFEDGKFRLYFPTPGKVEEIVDAATEADEEPTE